MPQPDRIRGTRPSRKLLRKQGVLWSIVGLGIRLVKDAVVWQILLYRSISLGLFLFVVIRLRTGETPFGHLRRVGFPAVTAGLSLVAAYSGTIYAIKATSFAHAMLLFAKALAWQRFWSGSFLRNLVADRCDHDRRQNRRRSPEGQSGRVGVRVWVRGFHRGAAFGKIRRYAAIGIPLRA